MPPSTTLYFPDINVWVALTYEGHVRALARLCRPGEGGRRGVRKDSKGAPPRIAKCLTGDEAGIIRGLTGAAWQSVAKVRRHGRHRRSPGHRTKNRSCGRLLTGGLEVRVLPEEPFLFTVHAGHAPKARRSLGEGEPRSGSGSRRTSRSACSERPICLDRSCPRPLQPR
jgi:hypothetical protein